MAASANWTAAVDRVLDTTANPPVVEKMALFWHGHFVSGRDKVD